MGAHSVIISVIDDAMRKFLPFNLAIRQKKASIASSMTPKKCSAEKIYYDCTPLHGGKTHLTGQKYVNSPFKQVFCCHKIEN